MLDLEIGQKVWIFDPDYRAYSKEDRGAPIFRAKFRERYVTDQTRVSWILSYEPNLPEWNKGTKYKKKDAHLHIFISEEEIDKKCWVHENRHKIAEAVSRRCNDYDKLKAIEAILNGGEVT